MVDRTVVVMARTVATQAAQASAVRVATASAQVAAIQVKVY